MSLIGSPAPQAEEEEEARIATATLLATPFWYGVRYGVLGLSSPHLVSSTLSALHYSVHYTPISPQVDERILLLLIPYLSDPYGTPPLAFSSHPISSHHCLSCHRTPPPPRLPTHPNFPSHRRRTSQSSCRNLAFSSPRLVELCHLVWPAPLSPLPSLPSIRTNYESTKSICLDLPRLASLKQQQAFASFPTPPVRLSHSLTHPLRALLFAASTCIKQQPQPQHQQPSTSTSLQFLDTRRRRCRRRPRRCPERDALFPFPQSTSPVPVPVPGSTPPQSRSPKLLCKPCRYRPRPLPRNPQLAETN
ncbi:hypothetical protein BDP81DRAFT_59138 [Colletotrichum phormii]|uniref:Uncharacterized protein n=1 Tax=Colletotrichum phormii TaxID=359342 RepID=A0AAI9ZLZ8_9PEZI|nr:uncharacterized protein BDP81DRAFT_59138 [Colletotrichum phormii]KAK1634441.1 hypothetical protein BDP81DRAFT_59138 [Colletotrichum phormii]